MISDIEDRDTFHDCQSEDDNIEELGVGLGHGDAVVCTRAPCFDDPVEIRAVLERAAVATQRLLRCYGGTNRVVRPSMTQFYPATLELSACLHTDDFCPCPKDRQCKLKGDPVTLKLPIELNPESGQVKVNIFQPKSMGTICGCSTEAGDKSKSKNRRHSDRSVRWRSKDDFCCNCEEQFKRP
ncbi:hypothetical protein KR009_000818 [Drosophila setifemur]|nr:hypothetical protein KR009_000818 [Drosophila setifemur]